MKKFFKFGCGGLIALFGLLMILGALLGNKNNEDSDVEKITTSLEGSQKENDSAVEKEKKKGIGEELSIGKVVFKVNSIEETNIVTAGNGVFKYEPSGDGAVFFIVNLTVRNDGNELINTDSSFFKLVSDSGVEYTPSTVITADEKFFLFDGINPGLSKTGSVLFEVPAGLTGLDLKVKTGLWGSKSGVIKLN